MPSSTTEFVASVLLRHTRTARAAALDDATPLLDGGLELDSIGLLDALVEIEKELGLTLREEDLTLEVLSTFGNFVRHIVARAAKAPQ